MERPEPDPEKLQRLAGIFRSLGATNPESFARSQLGEGIPQLALFVFLKQAWESIIDEQKTDDWFDALKEIGAKYPNAGWGDLAAAVDKVVSHGASRAELARLIQLIQHDTLNRLCFLLDDGGFASPLNVGKNEEWPWVHWALHQVDEDGKVVASLEGLHEYSDGEPPNGRESGFR